MNLLKSQRICWIAFMSVATVLAVAAVAYRYFQTFHHEPWQLLAQVKQLEQAGGDGMSVQMLAWNLAILGRDDEVRRIDFFPNFEPPRSSVAVEELELVVVPWRSGFNDIAANNRVVMIMEDHAVSKHREFIGATLPIFRDARFTHYAAEAISQFDTSLSQRGYPNKFTGLYTSDPQFGNVLRRALNLEFVVLGYDAVVGMSTHEEREELAATKLASTFQNNAETRMLVHAGHAHVLKHEIENGQRWLASLLWEKTGVEPFTIWQWSTKHDAHDYEKIVGALIARGVSFDEPVLLMPPPSVSCGLQESPYRLASVDAIVLHPPDQSVAPAKRTVLFPDAMRQLAGRWTANQWPVVLSAYRQGEPIDAIPLDQVMLRHDERDFVLWIPDGTEYEIRVFSSSGLLKSRVETATSSISVDL